MGTGGDDIRIKKYMTEETYRSVNLFSPPVDVVGFGRMENYGEGFYERRFDVGWLVYMFSGKLVRFYILNVLEL